MGSPLSTCKLCLELGHSNTICTALKPMFSHYKANRSVVKKSHKFIHPIVMATILDVYDVQKGHGCLFACALCIHENLWQYKRDVCLQLTSEEVLSGAFLREKKMQSYSQSS